MVLPNKFLLLSATAIFLATVLGTGLVFSPYIRTQVQSVHTAADPSDDFTETAIISNKLLVRLTSDQVRDVAKKLSATPTPSPTPTATPTPTPPPEPSVEAETTLEPEAEKALEPPSEPAASAEPTPTSTPTPTAIPEEMPEAIDTPLPSPGEVLGTASDSLPGLPDFASIEHLMKDIEFVAPPTEITLQQTEVSLVELLTTKITGGNLRENIPNIERWVEIDLTGPQEPIWVVSKDLRPIGKPKTPDFSKPEAERKVEREEIPPDADAKLENTRKALDTLRTLEIFDAVVPVKAMAALDTVPNEPAFSALGSIGQPYDDMWHLKRIQAPAAWDVTVGSAQVTVAVVDTGIDYTHRDLQGNIWENGGEVGVDSKGQDKKTNSVDDDLNGYVDDWHGWDFYSSDNDPKDLYGHGTHIAGTIGAKTNNSTDIPGIMSNVRIMPVQFLSEFGDGSEAGGAAALRYAADNGAKVINTSWGFPGTSLIIHDAIEYAHAKGALIIASAGNSGCDLGFKSCWKTPAVEEKVMTIGALTPRDSKAPFSNYGDKIDLFAPGGDWGEFKSSNILSLRAAGTGMGRPFSPTLTFAGGTSMASPHVAGVAGLLFSIHPDWTNEKVRAELNRTADDIGEAGKDPVFGYGVLNAARAVGKNSWVSTIHSPNEQAYFEKGPGAGQTVDIVGTVNGEGMQNYIVESSVTVAGGKGPWVKIAEGTTALTNKVLKQFTPSLLTSERDVTIRLTVNPGTPVQTQLLREFHVAQRLGLYINEGAETVSSRDVTLTLWAYEYSYPNNLKKVRLRNAGEAWGAWQPWAETKPWTLPVGDGLKTVEAEFQYYPGQITSQQAKILLDTTGVTNRPPVVEAGVSSHITPHKPMALDATVTDDGRPTPPGALTTVWSKASGTGTGTATFGNVNAVDTTVTFSAPNQSYQLKLTVSDGQYTSSDTINVYVYPEADKLSYLKSVVNRPRLGESVLKNQELPVDTAFQFLKTDVLSCVTIKLDGVIQSPAGDGDAYRQTSAQALPACP